MTSAELPQISNESQKQTGAQGLVLEGSQVRAYFNAEDLDAEGGARSYALGVEVSGHYSTEGTKPTREDALLAVAQYAANVLGYELIERPKAEE
jgi:hypothetical protein